MIRHFGEEEHALSRQLAQAQISATILSSPKYLSLLTHDEQLQLLQEILRNSQYTFTLNLRLDAKLLLKSN